MKKNKVVLIYIIIILYQNLFAISFYLPINIPNRRILTKSIIEPAGDFGIWRKPYRGMKGHFHAGIDIRNPNRSIGAIEAIYACAEGKVISVYEHGPSSTIIIKHKHHDKFIYSVYTHIADIVVEPGDSVNQFSVIASFIDKPQLKKWGVFFNHLHFEILKIAPKYDGKINGRDTYSSYSTQCKTLDILHYYFYNPKYFFINR